MFCSMVKNKPSYPNVVKLQHLLNSVEGAAKERLRGLAVTDSNFDIAWERLVKRFDNSRIRLSLFLESLINLESIKRHSIVDWNRLVDTVDIAIQGLKDLKVDVNSMDVWLVHLIVKKLDYKTKEEWEISQEDKTGFPLTLTCRNFWKLG